MGINPITLSDKQLNMIDAKDRKPLGKAGTTQKEFAAVQYVKSERAIHDMVSAFLRRHELPFVHTDPTRKSSIIPGHPDFLITKWSRSLYIEFKIHPNTLQKVQEDYIAFLVRNHCIVHVITETTPGSAYQWATDVLTLFFNL